MNEDQSAQPNESPVEAVRYTDHQPFGGWSVVFLFASIYKHKSS